jgi:maleate isomerase
MRLATIDPHRFAVLIPATNTIVEADFQRLEVPEATWHFGRVAISDESLDSDDSFGQFLEILRSGMMDALGRVLSCEPDFVVMGMSAETFWGGKEGNEEFERVLRTRSGRPVFTGATACATALSEFRARRISVLTPYQQVGDVQVRRFFEDLGHEIVELRGLRCPSATAIGRVPPHEVAEHLLSLARGDVDAVVQVGTNLRGSEVAPFVEHLTGKPIIAVNTAIAWNALRSAGIPRRVPDWGLLLSQL